MTDILRRRLEREALTGDLEAEVRLLCARLRARELCTTRLRVAAHLGHEAARRVLGEDAPAEIPVADIHRWAFAVGEYAPAAARAGLVLMDELVRDDLVPVHSRSVGEAIAAWGRSPSAETARAARARADEYKMIADWNLYSRAIELIACLPTATNPRNGVANAVNRVMLSAGSGDRRARAARLRRKVTEALLPWILSDEGPPAFDLPALRAVRRSPRVERQAAPEQRASPGPQAQRMPEPWREAGSLLGVALASCAAYLLLGLTAAAVVGLLGLNVAAIYGLFSSDNSLWPAETPPPSGVSAQGGRLTIGIG